MGQFPERVARNIKKYRKEQNLTLKEMAERVGISEATMQKICDNSHFGINEIIDKKELDIERVFPQCSILYGNNRYSISLSKYK